MKNQLVKIFTPANAKEYWRERIFMAWLSIVLQLITITLVVII